MANLYGDDDYRRRLAAAIQQTAGGIGANPEDLATAMTYETANTLDPWKTGPTTQWGTHHGLIQWGEPQAKQYGITMNTPVEDQVSAVGKYLQDRGFKPGMGMPDLYSAINAGHVGMYNASDASNGGAPGTVMDKVNSQMGPSRRIAQGLLGSVPAPAPPSAPMMGANGQPIYGTNLFGGGGGVNVAGGGAPPPALPPPASAPQPLMQPSDGGVPTTAPVPPPVQGQPIGSPIDAAQKTYDAQPLGTRIADQVQSGNPIGALGALGSSQGFMDAAGGLAKTMTGGGASGAGQAQKAGPPPPPNLDTNSAAIAQAAPQLMAQLMARRRIPGMSIGGMA
jgi:hypothetical protein